MVASPRPQNTSRTVTGSIRRRDNAPINSNVEIRVKAFDQSPNGEVSLSELTPTTSARTYLIAYNFSPTPSRKTPNLIVKAFDNQGNVLGVSDPRPNASAVENNVDILIGTQPRPTTYRITGQVKTTSTNQTFPGVRVEATFRRGNQTLLTRNSTADANSNYAVTFSSTPFPNSSQPSGITVFFQVYQDNQRLDTDTVIQNLQTRNYQQDIEIKPSEESPGDHFIVRGTICHPDGNAAAGIFVQALDKDMLRDEKLGEQLTNQLGQYEISYTRAQFSQAENLNADVFIRVSHPNVPEVTLGESEVIYHARPIETIDLTVSRTSNEFEQHKAALDKIRANRAIADFTPDNIEFCTHETGIPRQQIELLVAAFQLFQQTRMAAEVFYGIGRQLPLPSLSLAVLAQQERETLRQALVNAENANTIHLPEDIESILSKLLLLLGQESEETIPEPVLSRDEILNLDDAAEQTPAHLQTANPALFQQLVDKAIYSVHQAIATHFQDASYELKYFIRTLDLRAIATPDTTVPSFLTDAIRHSQLPDLIQQEGQAKINSWNGPQTLNEILQPDTDLRANPLFVNEFRQAGVFRIGTLTQLSNDKVQQLMSRGFSLEDIAPDKLTTLVNEGVLTDNEAQELGFNANLYQLSSTNLNLVNALKNLGGEFSSASLKDLAPLSRQQWEDLLEQNVITPPAQANRADYAAFLHRQIEVLYPHDVFRWQHRPVEANNFLGNLSQIAPLLAQNDRLFNGIPFSTLNLENIDPQTRPTVESAYTDLSQLANRYPGLELHGVLANRELSSQSKLAEGTRRVNLMEQFYQRHEMTPFLSLDYSPDSQDLAQLNFTDVASGDRRLILNNLKADQRIYRVTRDAEHTFLLKENGYQAAHQIAADSFNNFVRTTNLPVPTARQYYQNAQGIAVELTAKFGTILDYLNGGLDWLRVDTTSPEVRPYLQRLEGYSTLFGNQDFCKCKHCQSILSPAAYFVDLMDFLKKHVLDERFTGANAGHVLNPYNRRRDLWRQSLPLNCASTHTLVPYLTIILEILENYIVREDDIDLNDRNAVETLVYRSLYEQTELNSFRQPFCLPLVELQTYLQHFPTNLAAIARILLIDLDDPSEIIPQAELRLSHRDYDLIQTQNIAPVFLSHLYRRTVPIPTVSPPESKNLLHVMGISRQQLTDLVQTKFVEPTDPPLVEFRGSRRDGDPDLQPDMEVVQGLTPEILDRMHRFVRLWQQLDWSINELDQILQHIYAAMGDTADRNSLPLSIITQLYSLQKHLKVNVPDLCALFHEIPNQGEDSMCDRLFNLPIFIRNQTEATPSAWPSSSEFFHYPYPAETADAAATQRLHRLLAGLGLKDDELFQLIEHLRIPLGDSSAASFSFPLNLKNLSLLYRHARLAKLLKLTIPELFALLRLSPDVPTNSVENLTTLQAFVNLVQWQKTSGYSIRELAIILGDNYGSADDDETEVISPAQTSESLVEQILTEQSLIFADTVFAYFEGITEAQSQAIIRVNSAIIVPADIRTYRIAATVTDPETVSITIPPEIQSTLNDAQRNQLTETIREIIATYSQPGAPDISDRILVGTVGLTLSQSRTVLGANPTLFESVDQPNLHWLTADFTPSSTVIIPAGIPLRSEIVQAFLLRFYAGEVFATQLGRQLSLPVERVKALALLAGYDFTSNTFGNPLTRVLHSQLAITELTPLIAALQKLKLWFKDKSLTEAALTFLQAHSGGAEAIFQIAIADYRRPSLTHLKQTVRFQQLLKTVKVANGELEDLFASLVAFDYAGTRRFRNDAIDRLAASLGAQSGLVGALNQSLFPTFIAERSINRALAALEKLDRCVKLAQFLGIGGEALPLMIAREDSIAQEYNKLSQAVTAIVTAIRTKYDTEDAYQQKIGPFEDKIREQRRDALTDYLIHTLNPDIFQTTNDLYHYFLIDTELEGCARTSRVVAGISSLQLYIQRCLMNLEQSQDGRIRVLLEDVVANEWEWRKNYRVWEANRKVFLYPENYIEPDLRDDKTPLFEDLESELLQQDINAQTVLDAYSKYMKGFEEIARLQIAGAYHDRANGADVLHLFGVTASEPPEYYYRTIENIYESEDPKLAKGIVWNPWQKINLQIPVRKVSPIVYLGKLYVFWVDITTRPMNELLSGSSRFTGYKHIMSVKFTTLRLDKTWTPPQKITLQSNSAFPDGNGVIIDRLFDPSEVTTFLNTYPLVGDYTSVSDARTQTYLSRIFETVKDNPEILENTLPIFLQLAVLVETEGGKVAYLPTINFADNVVQKLFIPKYDREIHREPKDDYSLKSYLWDQVYPSIDQKSPQNKLMLVGRHFRMTSHVDFYTLSISSNPRNSLASVSSDIWEALRGIPTWKRLNLRGNALSFGHQFFIRSGEDFADAVRHLENQRSSLLGLVNLTDLLTLFGEQKSIVSINGSLTDGLINIDGDLLYLHSFEKSGLPYAIKRLGTTLSETISRRLFEAGINGILNIDFQTNKLKEAPAPVSLNVRQVVSDLDIFSVGKFDTRGSLGVYFREIFFHIPYLIANYLNSQGKYADAQRWYHYIFDPTSNNLPSEPARKADRVWQYIEFRNHTLQTLREQLNDRVAEEAYKNDPFNPHAIARLRLGAYMKSIVMKYIDNLLDWGDQLFTQDTMESINEATLLYVMAAEILGPRPIELGDCSERAETAQTFDQIDSRINSATTSTYAAEIETLAPGMRRGYDILARPRVMGILPTQVLGNASWYAAQGAIGTPFYQMTAFTSDVRIPEESTTTLAATSTTTFTIDAGVTLPRELLESGTQYFQGANWNTFHPWQPFFPLPSFGTSLIKQAQVFCIPKNQELLGYWDRVADRLYKIRNCMNISGLRRQLPLFAPEIDPRLLVRAKAAGIPLEDILNSISGNLPPYRFSFLIVKAKEYAGALQSFGAALLGAIEKQEAEELARLRLVHQDTILKLTTKLRDQEIAAAEASLDALRRREQMVIHRKEYYQSLISSGWTELENLQLSFKHLGNSLIPTTVLLYILSGKLDYIPKILGLASSTGADGPSQDLEKTGAALRFLSDLSHKASEIFGLQAGLERREQGWQFSLQQTNDELKEIEKQLQAATIRRDISVESREIHEKTLEQAQEIYEFYQDKFTNLGLYTWLSTQLQRLYREAYQSAMAMARLAERAYRFERGDDTTLLLDGNYWDGSHAGLLAGDKLMNALRHMERLYMETHYRNLEIDQAFSLTQIDPVALIQLKETGECEFSIPELYFDLFYPGHYRRRIKSARLTMPCITGPYTNVSATLTLTSSQIRKDPVLGSENLFDVPPTRSVSIATSTAQNDSGVFRLDFRDERYMPFEGAGAISSWKLTLPKNFRQFDYQTINDVILHISYTAEDGSSVFREQVEGTNAEVESAIRVFLGENSLKRVFSLRQEFSNPFNRLLRSAVNQPVQVEITEKRFPIFLQGALLNSLQITSAKIILVTPVPDNIGSFSMSIDGTSLSPFNPDSSVGGLPLFDLTETSTLTGSLTETLLGEHTFSINDAGGFAPEEPAPSDPSAIDPEKLIDILLYVEYGLRS
jgi:hypothetical protein